MTRRTTRRQFIAQVGVAGATLSLAVPRLARSASVNEKLAVGFVAAGGQAGSHTGYANGMGLNCICFAETDKTRWDGVLGKKGWEKAVGYTDWRKMLEKHAKDLNVIFVAMPDHSHFAPSMTAVSLGISCYTEKPLTWGVREAQLLAAAYAKNTKAVTQMGNQGHAGNGWRTAYELIKGGAVGDVLEFHTWTNRPIWPQGGDRPTGKDKVPATLNWDAWIGPAPMRPYVGKRTYHDFNWRGFVDFGSGALGDMACHTTDGIYAIMEPGYAATAEPIFMTAPVKDQFPAGMTIKMTFRPKADRPGFTTFWYEGKLSDGKDNMPETPEELKADEPPVAADRQPRHRHQGQDAGRRRLLGQRAADPRGQDEGVRQAQAALGALAGPPPGVHRGLQGRKAPRVQPVQLRLLGPDDGQHPTGQPVRPRRQEA